MLLLRKIQVSLSGRGKVIPIQPKMFPVKGRLKKIKSQTWDIVQNSAPPPFQTWDILK